MTYFFTLLLSLCITTTAFASKVEWFDGSIDRAIEHAQTLDKPIFIVIHAEWCGPCKHLLHETLEQADIAEYVNQHTVPFVIDGDLNPEIGEHYEFRWFPTVIVTRPNGEEIDRLRHYPGDMLPEQLRTALASGRTIPELLEAIAANPDEPELKYQLFNKYADRFKLNEASRVYDEIAQQHPAYFNKQKGELTFRLARTAYEEREYETAITLAEIVIAERHETYLERSYALISSAYFRQSEFEKAMINLRAGILDVSDSINLRATFIFVAAELNLHIAEAFTYAQDIINISASDVKKAYGYFLKSLLHYSQGAIDEALESIDLAISLDPEEPYYQHFKEEIEQGE